MRGVYRQDFRIQQACWPRRVETRERTQLQETDASATRKAEAEWAAAIAGNGIRAMLSGTMSRSNSICGATRARPSEFLLLRVGIRLAAYCLAGRQRPVMTEHDCEILPFCFAGSDWGRSHIRSALAP